MIHPGRVTEEPVEDMFPNRHKSTTPVEPIKGIPLEYLLELDGTGAQEGEAETH
jgi:hypothetical protein